MSSNDPSPMIELRSDFDVEIVATSGSDAMICKAARVSTLGADSIDSKESAGLINFLMSNRHGSPFEHGMMTFRISALIMVWREYMRHRIGFSYNEQSGRYMELAPVFYIPDENRALVQVGKTGEYKFVPGSDDQYSLVKSRLRKSYEAAWSTYQSLLKAGVAKEVSRMGLPLSIYSTAYVTCNPRSIMSFLSLRTKHDQALFPSGPQWEINQVANQMEELFDVNFPITSAAFTKNGRVSP